MACDSTHYDLQLSIIVFYLFGQASDSRELEFRRTSNCEGLIMDCCLGPSGFVVDIYHQGFCVNGYKMSYDKLPNAPVITPYPNGWTSPRFEKGKLISAQVTGRLEYLTLGFSTLFEG